MLSEVSQTGKDILYDLPYLWNQRQSHMCSQKQRVKPWLPQAEGGGGVGNGEMLVKDTNFQF